MTVDEIKLKISAEFAKAYIDIVGDGCNCQAVIISDDFEGLSLLARQRKILALFNHEIKSGELHALSIKAYTNKEYNLNKAGSGLS